MSWRYFLASICIEQCLGLLDGLPEVGVLDGRPDDEIDGPAQQQLERFEQAEVGIGVLPWRKSLEVDQKVEIAPLRVEVVARRRAEQRQAAHVMTPAELGQLGAMHVDRWS